MHAYATLCTLSNCHLVWLPRMYTAYSGSVHGMLHETILCNGEGLYSITSPLVTFQTDHVKDQCNSGALHFSCQNTSRSAGDHYNV